MDEQKETVSPPNQAFIFPTCTIDYRVSKGKLGVCLVANRDIKKGRAIFDNSLEYDFSQVINGDQLLFDANWLKDEPGWKMKINSRKILPRFYNVTRETLFETHGVPYLLPDPTGKTGGQEDYRLEVPGMFSNHSCDPNMEEGSDGEDYATRDIRKGEELTCDYAKYVYYELEPARECKCGSSNCRGKMRGWLGLSDKEKNELLPKVSGAIRAHHMADIGEGPPIEEADDHLDESPENLPVRNMSSDGAFRLVCPGPGSAADMTGIDIQPIEEEEEEEEEEGKNKYGLFASKDFAKGDLVYEYWVQPWPKDLPKEFDMIAPTAQPGRDKCYQEGTVVRINADTCARKYPNGKLKFSTWDLLVGHSTEPNILHEDEDDGENWGSAYATRDIKAGEQIMASLNSVPSLTQ